MSNLTRIDPFSAGFDDWFKGLMLRPMRMDIDMPESMRMKMDVMRSDDSYAVKAEMPGVKMPQDIDEAKVAAQYSDGVLELELPRKAKSADRKIEVK